MEKQFPFKTFSDILIVIFIFTYVFIRITDLNAKYQPTENFVGVPKQLLHRSNINRFNGLIILVVLNGLTIGLTCYQRKLSNPTRKRIIIDSLGTHAFLTYFFVHLMVDVCTQQSHTRCFMAHNNFRLVSIHTV